MKPQDVVFIAVLIVLLIAHRPKWLIAAGLICLAISIPLFSLWIFFTAQRLVYYGAGFLLVGIVIMIVWERIKK